MRLVLRTKLNCLVGVQVRGALVAELIKADDHAVGGSLQVLGHDILNRLIKVLKCVCCLVAEKSWAERRIEERRCLLM